MWELLCGVLFVIDFRNDILRKMCQNVIFVAKKVKWETERGYDNILRNKKEAIIVKFRFSEKAIKIWHILTIVFSNVKAKKKIAPNFCGPSEYINFNRYTDNVMGAPERHRNSSKLHCAQVIYAFYFHIEWLPP